MLIKKETEYATMGLIALYKKGDKFSDIKQIAREEKIPVELLSKIFQKLTRSKIVESRIGSNGGFRLKKQAKHIHLLNILEAVQQKNILKCYAGEASYCKKNCPLKKVIRGIEKNLDGYLSKITLLDLIYKY